ncbi:ABC transporter ATP-binding protein, partial [Candidatus Bathyarchaeota archaeon]
MTEEILKLNNLRVYYRVLRGYVKAVDNISLSINRGEAVGLAGESGCGKTTAMMAILRLLPYNADVSGEIIFEGKDILNMPLEVFRKEIRWKKISTIFQGAMNALHPTMTIG